MCRGWSLGLSEGYRRGSEVGLQCGAGRASEGAEWGSLGLWDTEAEKGAMGLRGAGPQAPGSASESVLLPGLRALPGHLCLRP